MKKKVVKEVKPVFVRQIRLNQQVLVCKKGQDYAEVVFVGDVHLGSPQCDVPRFKKMLDYCNEHMIYIFLMGDLIEMSTRDSVGAGVYEQEYNGQSQYELMVTLLKPLADKKLILGIHNGNHEERVYKSTGVDVAKMFSRELKVRYLGDACWSKFKVGKQSYSIYSLHGRTGSRFDGTALLALERISVSFFCDLIVMGHAHKLISSSVIIQKIDNNLVKEHKKTLLISGSYLKYDGGYGQALGLPISKLGSPKVKFYATTKDIYVSW
jgi:predicted phosphodiesterase